MTKMECAVDIQGYEISETIYIGSRRAYFRGIRRKDRLPVILKTSPPQLTAEYQRAQLIHEVEILKNLSIQGIARPLQTEIASDTVCLAMENRNGLPLEKFVAHRRIDLEEFLTVALGLTGIIADLHGCNVVHKDLHPDNVFFDAVAGQVWLSDFSFASLAVSESADVVNPDIKQGTVTYNSPEQSGRMNRPLDYRTDFYSLGVIFYQMLTGILPFRSSDPLSLVHSHFTVLPVSPDHIEPSVPECVSAVVLKLLAKVPEDRYQNARGLKADLERCREIVRSDDRSAVFPLGRDDIPERLIFPSKLYGREQAIERLCELYEHSIRGENRLVMLSGFSGVGKTSLVQEFSRQVVAKPGHMIFGRFDPFRSHKPYGALVGAFRNLIRLLLAESDPMLDHWRTKLRKVLGKYGQLMVDVIPDLETVIGPQAPVKKLDPDGELNRFNTVFLRFVRVFCQKGHPLTLFLDDIQWADRTTLALIELLVNDTRIRYLMVMGSYHKADVAEIRPLTDMLLRLQNAGRLVHRLEVNPLSVEHVACLLADVLRQDASALGSLAELVSRKTAGNPFFVRQFLTKMYETKLLSFDNKLGKWEWNPAGIREESITDNVITLLNERWRMLPADTRKLLSAAACIGGRFDINTLVLVTEGKTQEVFSRLLPAIRADLVVFLSTEGGFGEPERGGFFDVNMFKFQHDSVQKTSYSELEDEEKKLMHLRLGRILSQLAESWPTDEGLFDIVGHYNIAVSSIVEKNEREHVARLNLTAGEKARKSGAFEQAVEFLLAGIESLAVDGWSSRYDVMLALCSECAEAARLKGDLELMADMFDRVRQHAASDLDAVRAYKCRIQGYVVQNQLAEALECCLDILEKLGAPIPHLPTPDDVERGLADLRSQLAERSMEELENPHPMTDERAISIVSVIGTAATTVFFGSPTLFPLMVCKAMSLSLKYGNASFSAASYALYAIFLCSGGDDVDTGYRFGRLALDLVERFDIGEWKAKILVGLGGQVLHWKEPLRDTLAAFLDSIQPGLENGDHEFVGYAHSMYCSISFFAGRNLEETARDMRESGSRVERLKERASVESIRVFHQTVLNLKGENSDPTRLIGRAYDEREVSLQEREAEYFSPMINIHLCKAILCYLFEDFVRSNDYLDLAERERKRNHRNLGLFLETLITFYRILARLAIYPQIPDGDKENVMAEVLACRDRIKTWAERAPMNHLHRYRLVEAEIARVLGRRDQAEKSYAEAVELAAENRFPNDEALGYELWFKFRAAQGDDPTAVKWLQETLDRYRRWGALGKVAQLTRQYASWLTDSESQETRPVRSSAYDLRSEGRSANELDMLSLTKAYQTITAELELDRLLPALMQIVIENAGAKTGYLVLNGSDGLSVVTRGSTDKDETSPSLPMPLEETQDLSRGVVNYVARTRELVVLDENDIRLQYANDAYLQKHRPLSVLGCPILRQSRLVGVIYLENRLIADVFNSERLRMVQLLLSQIAISIENAWLYEQRRKAEENYRGIFENAMEGIFQFSAEGRFVDANPAMARMLGYESAEELKSLSSEDALKLFVSSEAPTELFAVLNQARNVSEYEMEIYRKNGERINVSLHARPVFDEKGQLRFLEGIIADITQRKRATLALQEREENLRRENVRLRTHIQDRYRFGNIIGKSTAMQKVYEIMLKAAGSEANIVIYGETGTGKELVARSIHEMSERRKHRFVPVNCGAIPDNLLESEFFGYKKGAFTGAYTDKKGLLDMADDGSLFLDELGEIDLSMQVKLLRVLDGEGYTPVGGHEVKKPNLRFITATNQDLKTMVGQGTFREDLFYRIHVLPIELPPLKERKEDIPLLIEHFIKAFGQKGNEPELTGKMLDALSAYHWPGNVRELQNVLQRFLTLDELDIPNASLESQADSISISVSYDDDGKSTFKSATEELERKLILTSLKKNNWRSVKAASHLGIPIASFYRKLKQYNIEKRD
ncbi:MAG: AAA family ATPase [Proteobacteria bacterium]|nr:AAA family ATPase [Pseudomonadota bacterium]